METSTSWRFEVHGTKRELYYAEKFLKECGWGVMKEEAVIVPFMSQPYSYTIDELKATVDKAQKHIEILYQSFNI